MMRWTVAKARQHFAKLLHHAHEEPQHIYNRDRFVVAVVDAETFTAFQRWQQEQRTSLGQALGELASICQEEDYTLEPPTRHNRPSPFDTPT